ncbi:MAG: aldo/keto reductase, partial [Gemmatimonadota bacterium]
NALQRRIEEDVLPTTRDLGLGNVVWSPLAQGVLTGKYRSVDDLPSDSRAAGRSAGFMGRYLRPEVLEVVNELVGLAGQAGSTPSQLAIAWCLRRPEVSSAIVGATKERHVDDNVAAADLDLGEEVFAEVDRILGGVSVKGV